MKMYKQILFEELFALLAGVVSCSEEIDTSQCHGVCDENQHSIVRCVRTKNGCRRMKQCSIDEQNCKRRLLNREPLKVTSSSLCRNIRSPLGGGPCAPRKPPIVNPDSHPQCHAVCHENQHSIVKCVRTKRGCRRMKQCSIDEENCKRRLLNRKLLKATSSSLCRKIRSPLGSGPCAPKKPAVVHPDSHPQCHAVCHENQHSIVKCVRTKRGCRRMKQCSIEEENCKRRLLNRKLLKATSSSLCRNIRSPLGSGPCAPKKPVIVNPDSPSLHLVHPQCHAVCHENQHSMVKCVQTKKGCRRMKQCSIEEENCKRRLVNRKPLKVTRTSLCRHIKSPLGTGRCAPEKPITFSTDSPGFHIMHPQCDGVCHKNQLSMVKCVRTRKGCRRMKQCSIEEENCKRRILNRRPLKVTSSSLCRNIRSPLGSGPCAPKKHVIDISDSQCHAVCHKNKPSMVKCVQDENGCRRMKQCSIEEENCIRHLLNQKPLRITRPSLCRHIKSPLGAGRCAPGKTVMVNPGSASFYFINLHNQNLIHLIYKNTNK